jgi:WD40 repeat protein
VLALRGHLSDVSGLAWSCDGRYLASISHDRTGRVWDGGPPGNTTIKDRNLVSGDPSAAVSNGRRIVLTGHSAQVNRLAYSPDGRTLVTASDDGTVRVWDLSTRREQAVLRGHFAQVVSLAISPDGRMIASGSGDWQKPKQSGELKLWDAVAGTCIADLKGHSGPVFSLAFSPDGQTPQRQPARHRLRAGQEGSGR